MSEWIEWNGGEECPVPGCDLEVQMRSGAVYQLKPRETVRWTHHGYVGDIVRYRRLTHTAQAVLRRAADLIEERAAQRDQPTGEKSMAKTVQAFNVIYGTELTEVQGWHFMELLKMVRSAYGQYVADDFDDKVAYAALAAEAAK